MRRVCAIAGLAAMAAASLAPAARAQAASADHSAAIGVMNFAPRSYQASARNWAVQDDNRGILYFANESGVLEFDGTRWRLIQLPGGRGAYALCRAADGRILVGSEGDAGFLAPDANGSLAFQSNTADLPQEFHDASDRVIQILDTPIGQAYVSDHWLFVRSPGTAPIAVRSDDHFMQAAWFRGALYLIDSVRGLTRLSGNTLQSIPGGADVRSLAMLVTEVGLVIPTYTQGLMRYVPDRTPAWEALHPDGWSPTSGAAITSGLVISSNLIALGTENEGILLMTGDGRVIKHIGSPDGIAGDHIFSMGTDHRGYLWLASEKGLSFINLGLPPDAGAAPFRAWVRSVVGTRDDHLLFGGAYFSRPAGVPQIEQGISQKLKFPYKYNAFRFDYSANGLETKGDMQFQTFMQGVDTDWSKWSTRSIREFTELAPGHWILRVRARDASGNISGEGSYELRISPAWYETWWFAILQVLAVIGLLLLPGHTPHKGLQQTLTTFAVIVPFIYIGDALGNLTNHYYPSDVGILRILMSSLLAFLLDPIQNFLKSLVEKRNKRRHEKRLQAV